MDPGNLNSYRPINNLSFASKLVERLVATRLVLHCDQNHLLPVQQSAFRWHQSIETAVLIVNDIIRAINKGQLMFLDLSSAFDTVDHDIMLSILHRRFSVEGRLSLFLCLLKWFHSYLTDHWQTFSVGNNKLECHRVSCRVPCRRYQCLGLWNSWPTLIMLICSIGMRLTTTCTQTINKSTCTLNQAWRPHA